MCMCTQFALATLRVFTMYYMYAHECVGFRVTIRESISINLTSYDAYAHNNFMLRVFDTQSCYVSFRFFTFGSYTVCSMEDG